MSDLHLLLVLFIEGENNEVKRYHEPLDFKTIKALAESVRTYEDQSEPVWVPERLTRRVPASEDGENHKQTNVSDADDHDGDADQQDDSRTPMGDSVGVPETTANQTFCSCFP
ncbi:hypothetical protein H671_8g19651 [Cricetulus griseus]|uniref:Uncharacterized protein n=1 Tax=Cricetulus griseus TaxID=10029 RepID=A0A061I1R2_CRIGR|nr:hypothetical protein H671_8g19651 [Cricetulus griseus]